MPLPTVVVLKSPEFFPRVLKTNEVDAIGSGAGVALYMDRLRELTAEDSPLLHMEEGTSGGYSYVLMHLIHRTIDEHPDAGVSRHLHACLVRRGGISIVKSDHLQVLEGGKQVNVTMPQVATTWEEFKALSRIHGLAAAEGHG